MQWWVSMSALCTLLALSGCGKVEQAQVASGDPLCFDYFQRCVNPVFDNASSYGGISGNTCSTGGCHGLSYSGTGSLVLPPGGSLQVFPAQTVVVLSNPPTATELQAAKISLMYSRNFAAARLSANPSNARQSNLIKKPLLEVSHGGNRIFPDDTVRGIQEFNWWISHPVKDEFSYTECAVLYPTLPAPPTSITPPGTCKY